MDWGAIVLTALISAMTTLVVLALVYVFLVRPKVEAHTQSLAEEFERRVKDGALAAGEQLLPKFREQVTEGFKQGIRDTARGEHVEESVRAVARTGADLLEEGLGVLLGRKK